MTALGRVLALNDTVTPFTSDTWNDQYSAYRNRIPGWDIDSDMAMKLAAVYACTVVICETLGTLPLNIYERLADDARRLSGTHPLQELLHDQPNRYQTAVDFREMMTAMAIFRGVAIAEIVPGVRGPVDQLIPLHPDCLRREVSASGVRYRYWDPKLKRERILLEGDLFRINGRFGKSVLDYARQSFALDLSLQGHASYTFEHAARPTGALSHPKTLSPAARANIRDELDQYAAGGDKAGKPLLLEEGMTWETIGLSNSDSEFLAMINFGVSQASRWFRVPPHKIYAMERQTNNNISQLAVDYVTDSILPWGIRWEQAIRRDLIIAKGRFFAEHLVDGLLRGDTKTRYAAYAIGRQWGWLSTNDIRRKENMNPVPGGDDDYLVPANITGRPTTAIPGTSAYLRTLVKDAAARVVRKETAALEKLAAKNGERADLVNAFYDDHARFVQDVLRIPAGDAKAYAERRALAAITGTDDEAPEAELVELALDHSKLLTEGAA
jgi:HK97 family phage portal protein